MIDVLNRDVFILSKNTTAHLIYTHQITTAKVRDVITHGEKHQ